MCLEYMCWINHIPEFCDRREAEGREMRKVGQGSAGEQGIESFLKLVSTLNELFDG
ncbi:MAG: hypothetical protein OHK0047_40520 [Leptolyngbyaceae cyanobacterium]